MELITAHGIPTTEQNQHVRVGSMSCVRCLTCAWRSREVNGVLAQLIDSIEEPPAPKLGFVQRTLHPSADRLPQRMRPVLTTPTRRSSARRWGKLTVFNRPRWLGIVSPTFIKKRQGTTTR